MAPEYDFKAIEEKWQKRWEAEGVFEAADFSDKPKKYILVEFPYPSGDGLHVGHCRSYTALDIVARKSRMEGFNVLFPIGWDAFGLPTENYAIKTGIHPVEATKKNTDTFRRQMKALGFSFDWSREVNTTDHSYYKWTQWIFLQFYEAGLAYKEKSRINWCPSCKIGLANEEVVAGMCERCGTAVARREMEQWMLKITAYGDKLLDGLKEVDFPKRVKEQQRNWIGRSEGIDIKYKIKGTDQVITCFTTRPETNFGATFIVLAPEHSLVQKIISGAIKSENKEMVEEYAARVAVKSERERQEEGRKKSGVPCGLTATNELTGEEMSIWVSDFVLMNVGTGAVVGVPGHDIRDFEFAQTMGLPIKRVVVGTDGDESAITRPEQVQEEAGRMINSGFLDGLENLEAKDKIMDHLEEKGWGQRSVSWRLRDWIFSRQHYWGEPIPIIYCKKCGEVPVPDKDLPVKLPPVERYEPTDTGESPLAKIKGWVQVPCPRCGGIGRRETDTMPNWAGSSWYYLRYTDPGNKEKFADEKLLDYWLAVDIYNGGMEHTTLHLLYSRFWHKFLFDKGLVPNSEPYARRTSHGMVLGEGGVKMSKSRGNVINPDHVVDEFGADALRVYEMFMGPFENMVEWSTASVIGVKRFFDRLWLLKEAVAGAGQDRAGGEEELLLQQTIKRVSEGIDKFKFNTAVAALMEMLNGLEKKATFTQRTWEKYVLLLSPFAPHLAEELWARMGHQGSLCFEKWPDWDEGVLAAAKTTIPVQVNGRVRGEILVDAGAAKESVQEESRALPNVARFLAEGKIIKVIFVPGKMINFVVK